ncbi:MAG: LD-carboxypeptidase [Chloroherpetonaceae bacterium]|nr:LD-carboxypeptidase [Chthonomonadaceae bacterium]MDW8208380.1 LD-carboxypeptidase [Chloroherpetonaceae bacterium]
MRRPRALKPGSTIGVVAPASPVDADALQRGIATIEARGYRVVLAPHVQDRAPHCDYLAGIDSARAADLNAMFARQDIDAVFCARGGYGSARLLDLLDREVIATNPRIFLGYSDITALHNAIGSCARMITFYAKMVCGLDELQGEAARLFWELLERPDPYGVLPAPPDRLTTLVPGTTEGRLAGGCLSLLGHACGTADPPDLAGKIVLIEDVGEPIYRADRYLIQLRNAGLLQQAAGFVVGHLTRWREEESPNTPNTPEALWMDLLAPLNRPAITGFPFGHEPNPLSLPLGAMARLDADARTLTLLEPAVSA